MDKIYVVEMNGTPIRAAKTKEIAENYIQCLKEETDDNGEYLYDGDYFHIGMLYLDGE